PSLVASQIHRRLLYDDNRGVGEALNEPGAGGQGLVIRGRHLLLLDTVEAAADRHRPLAQALLTAPYPLLLPGLGPSPSFQRQFSGLKRELPPNIHLLSLIPQAGGKVLLRLEHQFGRGESSNGSQPTLFSAFSISSVQEMALGGDLPLAAVKRLHWTPATG
ncbi:MA2B1 mannosidase, partial [Galbula dea]|nr:MA2B1 mannosidase [Galbula dea]